jgi:hypothetical protein
MDMENKTTSDEQQDTKMRHNGNNESIHGEVGIGIIEEFGYQPAYRRVFEGVGSFAIVLAVASSVLLPLTESLPRNADKLMEPKAYDCNYHHFLLPNHLRRLLGSYLVRTITIRGRSTSVNTVNPGVGSSRQSSSSHSQLP